MLTELCSLFAMLLLTNGCILALRQYFLKKLVSRSQEPCGLGEKCAAPTKVKSLEAINPDFHTENDDDDQNLQDETKAQSIIPSFIYIHNRLLLAVLDERISPAVNTKMSSLNYVFVSPHQTNVTEFLQRETQRKSRDKFTKPKIEDIYEFDQMACAVEAKYPTQRIVFQTGSDQNAQATISFLMGCHMMLSHGLGFEETYLAFRRLHSIMDPPTRDGPQISVKSCLRAFCRAKCSEWITFKDPVAGSPDKPGTMHIDEYLHYAW
jgi:hypothetical protein